MKIACYFGGRSRLGGAERRLSRIFNEMAQKGVEVQLIFRLYEPMEAVEEAYRDVIGQPFCLKLIGRSSGREIFSYLRKEKFDYAFYTDPYRAMLPFFFGAKLSGSKTVLLQVTTTAAEQKFESLLSKKEFELVARLSNQIDCLYPCAVGMIQKQYPKQKVTVTPCPFTNLSVFSPGEKQKIIAFVGRWEYMKNVELFVKSMLSIQDQLWRMGYHVMLCGNGKAQIEQNVRELVKSSNYPQLFELPGYEKSQDVLPSAEIFVSLQLYNNYPSQSLLEAIACGCCVVASDQGDTYRLVKEPFGLLCSFEEKNISEGVLRFAQMSDEDKKKAKEAARSFAEIQFSIGNSVSHYMKMIEEEKQE